MAACKKDRFPHVKGSLRIEKHIRGHVASCNAPLERVKVKVRSHGEDNEDPRVKLTRVNIINDYTCINHRISMIEHSMPIIYRA